MDSSSTMLWNFGMLVLRLKFNLNIFIEEGIGDPDSLGTSSTVSDSDPLSMLLTSINRTVHSQNINTGLISIKIYFKF